MTMIEDKFDLHRFIEAQEAYGIYNQAVRELEQGCKCSHWIWFVFPQMKGLGYSYNSNYYGISCREEAEEYLKDEVLNERLRKVCQLLLNQVEQGKTAREVLGGIDARKACSCLTLFDAVSPNDIFGECLEKCYNGKHDGRTLKMLNISRNIDKDNAKS